MGTPKCLLAVAAFISCGGFGRMQDETRQLREKEQEKGWETNERDRMIQSEEDARELRKRESPTNRNHVCV